MANQRSRFSPRGRTVTPRRATAWELGPEGNLQASVSSVALFPTGLQAITDGIIIVRIRGEILGFLSSGSVALDGYAVSVGMCIVSENAFNAGVASIPDPTVDGDWEGWMYHRQFFLKASSAGGFQTRAGAERFEIDNKAMRKFKRIDVMVAVAQMQEVGTSIVNLNLATRVLVKLP